MQAITNLTGAPQWDAHGRLVPPGRIIAFEDAQLDPAPEPNPAELPALLAAQDVEPPKAKPVSQNEGRTGKPGPK